MPVEQENVYLQRINLVIDHIRQHVQAADALSLEALAQVAGFSPFHFHRSAWLCSFLYHLLQQNMVC